MLECRSTLAQERLEAYIIGLMHCIRREAPIREQFSNSEIIEILHYAADLFMDKPILLEFALPPNGLVVLGDLHGNIYSLLWSLEHHGLPPKTRYLLLGDYVDRGEHQLELLVLLLLMKIRWPEDVVMLRGNHESNNFMNGDYLQMITCGESFAKVCQNQLDSTLDVYYRFNQVFDVMPVAAVVSGFYFCCHGGVSQWMTCLENIQNIPRPTYAKEMKLLEGCLLADILWADPEPTSEKAFAVSSRGCGYTFNRQGLAAVLEALKLTTLIRGHEAVTNGIAQNFDDDSCITVHTAPTSLFKGNAALKLTCVDGAHHIERIAEENNLDVSLTVLCRTITKRFTETFKQSRFEEPSRSDSCRWCLNPPSSDSQDRIRLYGHQDLDLWVRQFALEWAEKDQLYNENDRFHRLDPVDRFYESKRIQRSVELFPAIYDLQFLKSGSSLKGGTFRILVSDIEQQFMERVCPNFEHERLRERVPFTSYDSAKLITEENENEKRVEEVLPSWLHRVLAFWRRFWSWITKFFGRRDELPDDNEEIIL